MLSSVEAIVRAVSIDSQEETPVVNGVMEASGVSWPE